MTLGISDGKFIKIDGMTCSHENSNDNLVKAKWKCSMDSNCTGVLDQYCVDSRVTYHWQFCNDVPVPHGNTQVETGFIFGIPTQKDLSCVWKKIDRDRKFAYITALYNGIFFSPHKFCPYTQIPSFSYWNLVPAQDLTSFPSLRLFTPQNNQSEAYTSYEELEPIRLFIEEKLGMVSLKVRYITPIS